VGHDIGPRETGKRQEPSDQDSLKPAAAEEGIPKREKNSKNDEKRVDEMISAIAAKKKIETIGKLRKEISIGRSERPAAKTLKQSKGVRSFAAPSGTTSTVTYEDRIRDEIHRQWDWPDTVKKSLEATIVIKIKKDGTISLYDMEWERKSGSRLFDKSVVDAIRNASPVTPPPHDGMEIGIRFYL
jgi:outer membrane biosynthesis protein TonB